MTAIKVVIDSEIGNNIDDTFSLALAAVSPELEVVGVTTTQLRSMDRALVAERILNGYGMSTSVCPGNELSYVTSPVVDLRRFLRSGKRRPPAVWDAADWLITTLRKHRGITYIANAPLTNLAAALRRAPEITGSIDQIVMMGGWFSTSIPESNILSDPAAAETVLRSGITIVALGYEVTLDCVLPFEWLQILRESPVKGTSILTELMDSWSGVVGGEVTLHDPLTVAYLCRPDLVHLRTERLSVSCYGGNARGSLYVDDERGVPVSVGVGCKKAEYIRFVVERLTGAWKEHPRLLLPQNDLDGLSDLTGRLSASLTQAAQWPVPPGYRHFVEGQEYTRIAQVLSGQLQVYERGRSKWAADAGCLVVIPTGFTGEMSSLDGGEIRFIDFMDTFGAFGPTEVNHSETTLISSLLPRFMAGPLPGAVDHFMRELMRLRKEMGLKAALSERACLWGLLAELVSGEQKRWNLVSETMDIIDRMDGVGITLDDLSSKAGLSRYQYIREFKRCSQTTPARYGMLKKMEKAKTLLATSEMSIGKLAHSMGYATTAAFSRAFDREVGMSPTKYRRLHQQRSLQP